MEPLESVNHDWTTFSMLRSGREHIGSVYWLSRSRCSSLEIPIQDSRSRSSANPEHEHRYGVEEDLPELTGDDPQIELERLFSDIRQIPL